MLPRPSSPRRTFARVAVVYAVLVASLPALTLDELKSDAGMTPKRFAANFETFDYEFHRQVQPPAVFLAERRGDCDDYAILARYVLRPRGFDARVIHVQMVGRIPHAVCYVTESKAYLDYNNRAYILNLQRSGSSLREIAAKVADSFNANWTLVCEFTYDYELKQRTIGRTVVKTAPPAQDIDRQTH